MKHIIKNLLISLLIISMWGCADFLDINQDPDVAEKPEIEKFLPSIIREASDVFSLQFSGINNVCAVYVHQLTSRESIDGYQIRGNDYAIRTAWEALYSESLADLKVLIDLTQVDVDENEKIDYAAYYAIANILKSYYYSQMVDLWGSIPYSEAITDINSPIWSPKFDVDKEIYHDIFAKLDEAVKLLNDENSQNLKLPGEDDLIYSGNLQKWVRFANTLILKLQNQVNKTDLYDATKVEDLLDNASSLLMKENEDFWLRYQVADGPENRHQGFISDYVGSQISLYCSPWFYEIMNGENDAIFSGNKDPRIPYYFYNQIKAGQEVKSPPLEYRNGGFVSIYFGSKGINRDHSVRDLATMVGIYPVGGRYDNGKGGKGDSKNATGDAPHRMFSYSERLYIQAEMEHRDGGDATALLRQAIEASFKQVDMVVDMTSTTQEVPILAGSEAVTTYIDNVMTEFAGANADGKLEIIMTQKWISTFGGNGVDQYTDYRRTGYPKLFDPVDGEASGGPDGSGVVPIEIARDYPVSFPYSTPELNTNANAPDQRSITEDKVFWN